MWITTSRGQSEQDLINLISEVLKDGRPKLIIADQYSAMKGKKFKEFLRGNGIKIEYICVDSPESNSTNERVNQTLGNAIRCKLYDKAYSCAWTAVAKECVDAYNYTHLL